MNPTIRKWILEICKKHNLSAYYYPPNGSYMIHYRGRIVAAFNDKNFFDLPAKYRERNLNGGKFGLNLNLGEKHYKQVFTNYHNGRKII